jgi:hypothetical protein
MAGHCEHSNELSNSIKGRKFLEYLSEYYCTAWDYVDSQSISQFLSLTNYHQGHTPTMCFSNVRFFGREKLNLNSMFVQ